MDFGTATRARLAGIFGLATTAFLAIGIVIPALAFRGRAGEPYSFLSHFISELGQLGVSRLAPLFNATLVAGGIFLLPFSLLLGLSMRRNPWAKLGMAIGVAAAIFCSLVGIFPMNRFDTHILVAMTFFRLGLAMTFLFTLAIFTQKPNDRILPNWINWSGLLSAASFSAFLFVVPSFPAPSSGQPVFPLGRAPLPLAIAEWCIYVSTMIWIAAISVSLLRDRPSSGLERRSGFFDIDDEGAQQLEEDLQRDG